MSGVNRLLAGQGLRFGFEEVLKVTEPRDLLNYLPEFKGKCRRDLREGATPSALTWSVPASQGSCTFRTTLHKDKTPTRRYRKKKKLIRVELRRICSSKIGSDTVESQHKNKIMLPYQNRLYPHLPNRFTKTSGLSKR